LRIEALVVNGSFDAVVVVVVVVVEWVLGH